MEFLSKLFEFSFFRMRARPISVIPEQELEKRALLDKKWACYRHEENLKDFKILDKMVHAQTKALQELRFESEELYQQAIQPDIDMVPFTAKGPMKTPPIENYDYVDGDYNDVTKKYDGENKQ